MMSAFFVFQHTLNRLFNKVILKLDKFFLKYEGEGEGGMGWGGGVKLTSPLSFPGKTTFKKPNLIRVRVQNYVDI